MQYTIFFLDIAMHLPIMVKLKCLLDDHTCLSSFLYTTQISFIYSFTDYLSSIYKMLSSILCSVDVTVN